MAAKTNYIVIVFGLYTLSCYFLAKSGLTFYPQLINFPDNSIEAITSVPPGPVAIVHYCHWVFFIFQPARVRKISKAGRNVNEAIMHAAVPSDITQPKVLMP
ncbi:MAG: hypothetical protein K0Q55_1379 [Verrucomicrobia bacterium]|nr:hypothetical protein [Verrucomicrobiota bacterium]